MRGDTIIIGTAGEKFTGLSGKTILIENDPTNVGTLMIGAKANASAIKGAKGFPLKSGKAITIEGCDQDELDCYSTSGNLTINFMILEPVADGRRLRL